MSLRLVFAGTPEAALPSLEALVGSRHDVVAVVTRPDAPTGRGRRLAPSPVRERAEAHGIPVLTPDRPRGEAFQRTLRDLGPDVCPVVAYGALLPGDVLAIPRVGWVNLHFSLLPAWRGAAPVQHAILAGDDVTGASTFLLDEGLDTGPVFGTMTEPIRPGDTSGDLLARLAEHGAGLLVATLDGIDDGTLVPAPQPTDGVSLAPKITVDDARVRWGDPALAVDRRIRACTPAPGAWTTFRGERLKVGPIGMPSARDLGDVALAPGELRSERHGVSVGTATGPVALGDVQPHGKRRMPATDWARGARLEAGERLGDA